ncbi:MAG TPA: hypothetical protein VFO98_04485, partial [Marmoricola sp.]|nr:hypothetical protein [Marmoricola sp.]
TSRLTRGTKPPQEGIVTATPAEPTVTEPTGTEPPAAATTPPEAPKPTEPPKAADPAPKANVWEDPEAAKAEIEKLRRENGAARTNAKAQAAEDAKKELANTIGKALGLVEDGAETDPAKLTESLTTAQADARRAQVELAVFRSATTAGGDPAALLDSTSFLASLDGIDPTDAPAVAEAITRAVEANPRLGAATDPRLPAPNPAQGASASGAGGVAQLTEADLTSMSPEQIETARKEGRLNDLLGIKST